MIPTYELILAEYFNLPEHHKFFDTTMEFDTQVEPITTDDLVELSKEFLPKLDQWHDVVHMLEVFSEELND